MIIISKPSEYDSAEIAIKLWGSNVDRKKKMVFVVVFDPLSGVEKSRPLVSDLGKIRI
jgi:hypothetical protein